MKYILDFDHTLFDTSKFATDTEIYKADGTWVTPKIWDIVNVKDYMYTDTMEWLASHPKECLMILTAVTLSLGPEAEGFQKVKLERSGVSAYVSEIKFMVGDKGPCVTELHDGSPTVFLDDKFEHLVSVKEACPAVHCIQMWRDDDLETMTDYNKTVRSDRNDIPVVQNLAELDTLVVTL